MSFEQFMGEAAQHFRENDRQLGQIREWQEYHDKEELERYGRIEAHMVSSAHELGRLKKIETYLVGNGAPGLLVRVDRLEQQSRLARGLIGLCLASLLALAGNLIYGWVTR